MDPRHGTQCLPPFGAQRQATVWRNISSVHVLSVFSRALSSRDCGRRAPPARSAGSRRSSSSPRSLNYSWPSGRAAVHDSCRSRAGPPEIDDGLATQSEPDPSAERCFGLEAPSKQVAQLLEASVTAAVNRSFRGQRRQGHLACRPIRQRSRQHRPPDGASTGLQQPSTV